MALKYLDSVTRINQKYWHFLLLLKVARTVIATVNTWLPSSSFLRIEYWCRVFNAVELLLEHTVPKQHFCPKINLQSFSNNEKTSWCISTFSRKYKYLLEPKINLLHSQFSGQKLDVLYSVLLATEVQIELMNVISKGAHKNYSWRTKSRESQGNIPMCMYSMWNKGSLHKEQVFYIWMKSVTK